MLYCADQFTNYLTPHPVLTMSSYIHTFEVRLQLESAYDTFDSALHDFIARYSDEEIKDRLFDGTDMSSLLRHAVHAETFDSESDY
jgi:hypothetical protein